MKQLEQARAALLVTRMSLRAFKDSHLMAWRHVGPFPPYVPSTGWMSFYTALHVCRSLDVYGIGWSLAGESFKRARHRSVGKAYYFYKHTKGDVTENNYYFKYVPLLIDGCSTDLAPLAHVHSCSIAVSILSGRLGSVGMPSSRHWGEDAGTLYHNNNPVILASE